MKNQKKGKKFELEVLKKYDRYRVCTFFGFVVSHASGEIDVFEIVIEIAEKRVVIEMNLLNRQISMEMKNSFIPTSKNDKTTLS